MKFLKLTFLIFIFPLLTAATAHKFYVSITKVEYVAEKQSLQIISKIFIDDIEDALQTRYDEDLRLDPEKETEREETFLKQYIFQKLKIAVNGTPVTFDYIGKEYETDIVKIYLEVTDISEVKTLEITNKVLMEMFEEQQNIIHYKSGGKRKSLVLEKDYPKGMLNFN
ncbi:MAG: hypothetical protein KJO05_02970 [Bacteroidia bacterium]|nr:hypothetical protein [Bacteroidia bacterium]MBT8276491.1 hypothetical protein [Bacteroidia bacterium]NNF32040.1 hypothetical protein [Flavobacteriaceae bacterium]NNJ82464.1 hypothetical protein [Flavobacteriaceae bacterium]NNM09829.1 hypothetical protein [Flavobacteriaceae bacterium]